MVALFKRRGFESEEASDLAQETFARAFVRLESLRDESATRSWLFAVAINVHRNALRKRGVRPPGAKVGEQDAQSVPVKSETGEGALSDLLSKEREELLRRALEELPPQMREAVYLRVGSDLTYRQIAMIQQVSDRHN